MIDVLSMFNEARRLPIGMPEFTPAGGTPLPTAEGALSEEAKTLLEAWKPTFDRINFATEMVGAYGKRFELQTKLVMAQMLTNVSKMNPNQWQKEATVAGTDVPSYAKQVLGTITRVYPRLFATQLFPVVPLAGPDGRYFFRDFMYDGTAAYVQGASGSGANYTATAPNVAVGDRTDQLSKFNPNYFKVAQGALANRVKLGITSMLVSVDSYRLVADLFYEGQDDYSAVYGGDLMGTLTNHMTDLLSWVTDRTLINTALANVPSSNAKTWNSNPTGYADLAPTEKRAYDDTIWQAIQSVVTAIQINTRLMTVSPNWAVCDPTVAERLLRLTSFAPVGNANDLLNGVGLGGAMRDLGVITSLGIRVIVDPQMTAGVILFGHKPQNDFVPAIGYLPYRPIVATQVLEQPAIGAREKGVYSRFGVAKPDGAVAASSQLAECYGTLTVS